MIHRWGFSEAHHGGQTAAKYATKPLHEHAREWSKETVHAIQRGASPKEALGRVATQWEGDADAIVSEHWTWRGTLKQRIHSKVEIVK